MSCYCINPFCEIRENADDADNCNSCGTPLLINGRIRLLRPLRELNYDPHVRVEVWEVDDMGTKWDTERRNRVMKVLKWGSEKIIELFERESKILRRLDHPGIARSTMDDFFIVVPNGFPLTLRCLVMDKVEGEDLHKWIQSNGKISQSQALDWMQQMMEILDYIHHREVFHRDIKPSNIVLQPDGKLVLVDFGGARRITDTYLAKLSASGGTSTSMSNYEITAVVSPGYTPLEQINGKAVPQSDFYSLARTFACLATGKPLIKISTDEKTGQLHWRKHAPQIEKSLADLIDEMMAPFPAQRPKTTEIILYRLKNLTLESKIQKITRSKSFLISAILILIGLGGLGIFKVVLPAIANGLVSEGQKLEVEGKPEQAQSFFQWAIILNSKIRQNISNFYFEKAGRNFKDLELTKAYYEKVIKYNPQDIDAYRNLALVCKYLNQSDCVFNQYKEAIKIKPNDWQLHYELGDMYDEFNKYELAENQYNIAIKLNEKAVPVINNLSRIKNIKEKYKEAETLALKGLELTNEAKIKTTLYKNLGWAKLGQKDYIQANRYLQMSRELDPTRTDTYCLLAQVQTAMGDKANAKISWDVCMSTESNLPEVMMWRQQLLNRLLDKL
ncbi:serine/threonine-protein kinase [Anabaena azotica]|uniref:non-specific serine/threonine protein kinase n=1 Tax=Anabaena azotica FACHB-119 TaxID=947527 RepID=A0ABR8DCQ8_9NOST|nr:serine/threonine-protein kinase [Anabaena azotica]MBD2505015.1 protein kinase [Anabaena azotica FACHB-119]